MAKYVHLDPWVHTQSIQFGHGLTATDRDYATRTAIVTGQKSDAQGLVEAENEIKTALTAEGTQSGSFWYHPEQTDLYLLKIQCQAGPSDRPNSVAAVLHYGRDSSINFPPTLDPFLAARCVGTRYDRVPVVTELNKVPDDAVGQEAARNETYRIEMQYVTVKRFRVDTVLSYNPEDEIKDIEPCVASDTVVLAGIERDPLSVAFAACVPRAFKTPAGTMWHVSYNLDYAPRGFLYVYWTLYPVRVEGFGYFYRVDLEDRIRYGYRDLPLVDRLPVFGGTGPKGVV